MSPPLEQHLNQLVETIHALLKITTANRESSAIAPAATPAKSSETYRLQRLKLPMNTAEEAMFAWIGVIITVRLQPTVRLSS